MLGIVAEYNPFHLGHQYQLDCAKKQTAAEETVVIMSGNFTQRGEPAIFDKYIRTKAALAQGVDLVLELPVIFSLASSGYFCRGAVLSLAHFGIDTLAFGSESNDLAVLSRAAEILAQEPLEYRQQLKKLLKEGHSYPKAQALALESVADIVLPTAEAPNDLLALGYLTTIQKYQLPIAPLPIQRIGSHIDDTTPGFLNASAIRKKILKQERYAPFVPQSTAAWLAQAQADGYIPLSLDAFASAIFAKLRTASLQELCMLPDVNEDLAHTLLKNAMLTNQLDDFLLRCKSKAYTLTRLRRTLCHLLLHITKEEVLQEPLYLRVLGFNQRGKEMLHRAKKNTSLPIITNASQGKKLLSRESYRCFSLDIRAAAVYALAQPQLTHASLQEEFSRFPIVWKSVF